MTFNIKAIPKNTLYVGIALIIVLLLCALLFSGGNSKPQYWHPTESVLDPSPYKAVELATPAGEQELHPLYPGLDNELIATQVDTETVYVGEKLHPEIKFSVTSPNGVLILSPEQRQDNQALMATRNQWSFSHQNNGRVEANIILEDLDDLPDISVAKSLNFKDVSIFARDFAVSGDTLSFDQSGFNDLDIYILSATTDSYTGETVYRETAYLSAFPWTAEPIRLPNGKLSGNEVWKVVISGVF